MKPQDYLNLLRVKAGKLNKQVGALGDVRQPEGFEKPDPEAPGAMSEAAGLEAVIRWYRPVLNVNNDRFVPGDGAAAMLSDPNGAASAALMTALKTSESTLNQVLRSVGRIELKNSTMPWAGTGWIIDSTLGSDIIVTNAHVADLFATSDGARFVFKRGFPETSRSQEPRIDFREEVGGATPREFPITEVIWISKNPAIDMALLRVNRVVGADQIDAPIKLLEESLKAEQMLAVVGYPGSGGGYDLEPFQKLFGVALGTKRFSPGFVTSEGGQQMHHDCSTLPGSSGSVVLDVKSGKAVGLHFAGHAFETNYAVTAKEIGAVLRGQPWLEQAVAVGNHVLGDVATAAPVPVQGGPTAAGCDCTVSMIVPLEISLKLGSPSLASGVPVKAGVVTPASPSVPPARDKASAARAAEKVREHLLGHRDVLSVRAGYLFRDGVITDDYGVVVGIAPGKSLSAEAYRLGSQLGGVEIVLEQADPETIAEQMLSIRREAFGGRKAGYERDLSGPRFSLEPVTDDMKMTLHVSPECGWKELSSFLKQDDCNQLTIGMYHLTAPHVVDAIKAIASNGRNQIKLTLDRQRGDLPASQHPDDTSGETKKNDVFERDTLRELEDLAGDRFKWAPAALGAQGLFPTAYHIKVAVWSQREANGDTTDKRFWLSSGNMQTSNQPVIDKDVADMVRADLEPYNREWHAIVEHQGLAATFRNHLEQDFEDNNALRLERAPSAEPLLVIREVPVERPRRRPPFRGFPPLVREGRLTVQPLLTPDNYPEVVEGLLRGATKRILIENQSFAFWKEIEETPEHFLRLAGVVKERQEAGVEVRIIIRSGFGNEKESLRRMKEFGIKADPEHARFFETCHTKGIVIDDEIAILGSQNWTAAGTGPNRDASLVIWDEKTNAYFAQIFEQDWWAAKGSVEDESVRLESVSVFSGRESILPAGNRVISLAEYFGET